MLSNNISKCCCIDVVAIFNKQQLQHYIASKIAKNICNLLNTMFEQLNLAFIVTTNNNLILLENTIKFAININEKNNKLSLKKNIKLYCYCNITLAFLNQISKKIDIKIKINCFNILTCLIKLSNLFLDLQYICYTHLKDLASYFKI